MLICLTNALRCWSIHLHTSYDISFECSRKYWWRLSFRDKTDVGHNVYVCCISQGSIKTPFKGDWWLWCHFVPNLLRYMCTNNYSNKERFDKVITKITWCSFFASQCMYQWKQGWILYSLLMSWWLLWQTPCVC